MLHPQCQSNLSDQAQLCCQAGNVVAVTAVTVAVCVQDDIHPELAPALPDPVPAESMGIRDAKQRQHAPEHLELAAETFYFA
jgi:hypothetical protein